MYSIKNSLKRVPIKICRNVRILKTIKKLWEMGEGGGC